MTDEGRTVFDRSGVPITVNDLSYIFPGVIGIVINIFCFCSLLIINPAIGIVKFSDINLLFTTESLLRKIVHLFKTGSDRLHYDTN